MMDCSACHKGIYFADDTQPVDSCSDCEDKNDKQE
jgi:hypothetical protein